MPALQPEADGEFHGGRDLRRVEGAALAAGPVWQECVGEESIQDSAEEVAGAPRRLGLLSFSREHTAASATILLTISALLSRVIGLFRDQYIAYMFGAGRATDAYNVAFILPELINYLLVGGAASISFVTLLERYRGQGREEEGERALSVILNTMVLVLGSAIVLAEIFTPKFTELWFRAGTADNLLCTRITRILLPGQLFFFMGGVLGSVLLVRKQFSYQAVAPLVYNIGIIAGGVLLAHRMGTASLGVGALVGAIAGPFLLNAVGAKRAGVRYLPVLDFGNQGLRDWVRMSLPLMLGVTIITLDSQILSYFAKHGAGDISRLAYAKKLFTAPMAILGQAAGAASMPFFASLFQRGQFESYAESVNRSVTRLVAFSLLASALMVAVAGPTVDLVFRRGAFTRADAASTAVSFGIFAVSLALWTSQAIYARAFYAAGETFAPMLAGTIVTLAALPIYFGLHRAFGLVGLAWASDVAILLQTGTLAVLLHRRYLVPLFGSAGGPDWGEIGKCCCAAGVSVAGAVLALRLVPVGRSYRADLLQIVVGGLVWAGLVLATLRVLRSKLRVPRGRGASTA